MMSMGFSYPQPVVAPGAFHYGSGSGFPSTSPEEEAQAAWHMGQQDKIGHPSVESSFLPAPPGTVYFGGDVVKPEQSSGPPAFDKAQMSRGLAPQTSDSQMPVDNISTQPQPPLPPAQALVTYDPAKRTEEFITLRMPAERGEEWRQEFMQVSQSGFHDRPTTDELLDHHMRTNKGMPRMLQPYQRVMRAGYDWRLSKRAPGVDLAFLKDQDRAYAELQEVICGKPVKGGYQKAKPVHAGPEVRRRVGGRPSRLHGGTLPVIEVRDDGDIFIDGKLLIGTLYTKVMGLAYSEKAADPSWRIANGVVDRCYYQGSKREARERPGSFFATDKAMVGDFVLRHPELFMAHSPLLSSAPAPPMDDLMLMRRMGGASAMEF